MKIIILAGGGGTRLFPLSRTNYPKQFLKIGDESSLLAQTIERFLPLVQPQDIVVVTNQDYYHHVKAVMAACGVQQAHILTEPVGRNTAPAIALAAKFCLDELGTPPEEVLFIATADHIIKPVEDFIKTVREGAVMAGKGYVVTFGIVPDKPETGYGYIQAGGKLENGYSVASFREKPDKATAQKYLADKNYYWNSGMFALTVDALLSEFKIHNPEIAKQLERPFVEMTADFEKMPNISFDYAIAEKSTKVGVIPLNADWRDIGSWDAIYEVLDKDKDDNAFIGDCIAVDCKKSLLLGQSRLIAGIGLEDLLVVETDDVVLVAQKGESQKVKDIVIELKAKGRREINEHTTTYRPWGSYTVLGEGPGYKLKKIVVTPGHRLSLQLHYHRSEHWIVIGGTAKVTIGEEEKMVHENESVFVPPSTLHRLENPGKVPLEIIEVQNGKYLEEDDIVRFDDIYGRK